MHGLINTAAGDLLRRKPDGAALQRTRSRPPHGPSAAMQRPLEVGARGLETSDRIDRTGPCHAFVITSAEGAR
jgi:hypothetical protein